MQKAARLINDKKPQHVLGKIKTAADQFKNPVIACLGLAFKADIDDLRESPALQIVEQLAKSQVAKLLIVEPHINKLPQCLDGTNCELVSLNEAVKLANAIVVLVDHTDFKCLDREQLNMKFIIDTRGVL